MWRQKGDSSTGLRRDRRVAWWFNDANRGVRRVTVDCSNALRLVCDTAAVRRDALASGGVFCHCGAAIMKKINLNKIPWRERKSPKGHYHRFLRDVALAFKNPSSGPAFRSEPPFEVELVRLPPGAKNFPFH